MIVLSQHSHTALSLSVFVVGADVQHWEGTDASGWEIQSQSGDWLGTVYEIWCSASVLWEGMGRPLSQGGLGAVPSGDRD